MKASTLLAATCALAWAFSLPALSRLPDPTPEQARAAAEKKAQAEAQAGEDKKTLSTSMDQVAQRWRKRAAQEGWTTHAPTAVAASAASGPPQQPPVTSEKAGNAAPSADVKKPESERPK